MSVAVATQSVSSSNLNLYLEELCFLSETQVDKDTKSESTHFEVTSNNYEVCDRKICGLRIKFKLVR